MIRKILAAGALAALAIGHQAQAGTFNISVNGPGVSGIFAVTYGTATDSTYSNAYEITGASGTFSDSNNGLAIANEAVIGIQPVNHATPETTNLLAPNDFSKFAVASGLPPTSNGSLTYDTLYWPGGSPPTASSYPFHGGFLDIYGLMVKLNNGDVVGLWSNGVGNPIGSGPIYGVAVATSANALDYVATGVSATVPEPGSFALLGTGLMLLAGMTMGASRRKRPLNT